MSKENEGAATCTSAASLMETLVWPSIGKIPLGHVEVAIETGKKAADLICQMMCEIPFRLARLRGKVVDVWLVLKKVTHCPFQ